MQRIALVVQLPAELAIRDTALDRAVPRSRSIAIMRLRCSSEIRSSGVSAMLLKEWREPSTRSFVLVAHQLLHLRDRFRGVQPGGAVGQITGPIALMLTHLGAPLD